LHFEEQTIISAGIKVDLMILIPIIKAYPAHTDGNCSKSGCPVLGHNTDDSGAVLFRNPRWGKFA
jgi:hypothetical protein